MPIHVISFLLLFFQFFHTGEGRLSAGNTKNNFTAAVLQHYSNFHKRPGARTFICSTAQEETDETETHTQAEHQVVFAQAIAAIKKYFLAAPEQPRHAYNNDTRCCEQSLLLLHCRFTI